MKCCSFLLFHFSKKYISFYVFKVTASSSFAAQLCVRVDIRFVRQAQTAQKALFAKQSVGERSSRGFLNDPFLTRRSAAMTM